jgi:hypothetical protein
MMDTDIVVKRDFVFKVNLVAVVRVRAADESAARQVVATVLGAPSTSEIRQTNRNHLEMGRDAAVTGVDFSIGQIKASNPLERRARLVALAKSWRRE